MRFSADGQLVATTAADGTVILWDVTDRGRPRAVDNLANADATDAALSPDGRFAGTVSSDGVQLWDLGHRGHSHRSGAPFSDDPVSRTGPVRLTFTAAGRLLVTARSDGTADVWDVRDKVRPVLLTSLASHSGDAVGAFSLDAAGRTLATSGDTTVVVRDLTELTRFTAVPVEALACAVAGSGFDSTEWRVLAPSLPSDRICAPRFPAAVVTSAR